MSGASMEQGIWVLHGGATVTIKLKDLYEEYVNGKIDEYEVYYADPHSIDLSREDNILKPLTASMPISEVIDNGIHQMITVTSEDDLKVTLGVNGALLDYTDIEPIHVTVNQPVYTKFYVTALASLGGRPGDNIYVRKIKGYEISGSCNVITVPTPNMIASSGFVIMS